MPHTPVLKKSYSIKMKKNVRKCFILQESALSFVLNDDLEKLTSLLAEVSLVSDDSKFHEALPEDHWLNQPCGNEAKFRSLLHLALEKKPEERAEKFGRVLLSAGARPDLYNELLGVAPIHVAAKQVGFHLSGKKSHALLQYIEWLLEPPTNPHC